ncbi:MAG: 50S ribosomal protein L35 [Planctomycetota bacterium]|nr:50S ribosomal protein L35 [Planctomycetota bacterium]
MPKNKPCKGLVKRIRITKNGKVKFRRAFGGHLRSHKSGSTMRSYRKPIYAKRSEVRRVRALLFTKVTSGEHTAHNKRTRTQADAKTDED